MQTGGGRGSKIRKICKRSLWMSPNTVIPQILFSCTRHIGWRWEIIFIPMWIALCVSLVGVLYTIIFAGILLRIPEVASFEQRRNTANSGLGKKNIKELPVRPIDWTGTFFPALTLRLCFTFYIALIWHQIGTRGKLLICRIQWAKIH